MSVKSLGACTPGAQDETINPYGGFKMTSAATGWALAQCSAATMPTFPGGSTIKCYWPVMQQLGILRTADGGRTWTDVSPPSVQNRTWHHAEFFLDATHAWVAEVSRTAAACVSQITTFVTSDGGRTWQQTGTIPIKTSKPTEDVFNIGLGNNMNFVDVQHGWLLVASPPTGGPDMMAAPSTLYSTKDGGQHWSLVATNPGSAALKSLAGCRPNYYYPGSGFRFTSATRGWMMVNCGTQAVLTTQDGGATWQPQQLPDCLCQVYQPSFIDATHAAITDPRSPVMLATTDGGASWAQQQVPAAAVRYFSFTDAKNGWIVAVEQLAKSYDTAVHRTTDGGRTWSLLGRPGFATPTSAKNGYYQILSVQFVDPNAGFVALGPMVTGSQSPPDRFGPQFQLVSTEDGGRSWKTILKQLPTQPCIAQYREIGYGNGGLTPAKFASASVAWARGGLRTTDGGARWRDVSPPALREGISTPLYPPGYVEFYLDGDHAWQTAVYGSTTTCSDHITTFATRDGGKTWQSSAPIALDLPSGYATGTIQLGFTSPQAGWMWVPVGFHADDMWSGKAATTAHLFVTADGGVTWRRVATIDDSVFQGLTPSNPNCRSGLGQVTFASETVGYMTANCVNSKIMATQDGGATWKAQSVPLPCDCTTQLPTFVDSKHGFMQIYGGKLGGSFVVSTSDGGATWQQMSSLPVPSTSYLMALTFADVNHVWALVTQPGWNKGVEPKFALHHSKDGGQTWSLVQEVVPIGRGGSLLFADEKHGMVAQPRNATWSITTPNFIDGQDVVLLVTSDGGHTWKTFKPAIG
jgi:photosystem II stability/assembly factor-like uncharacterized protein